MTIPKIRTSARQAAAKQRIQQIDDPSGSAPPFEHTSPTPGWIVNPARTEERHLIKTIIIHLQDDPMNTMDADVLRFVYKDWPRLTSLMNTKTTVKIVKTKLLQLNVDEYIYYTEDNDWDSGMITQLKASLIFICHPQIKHWFPNQLLQIWHRIRPSQRQRILHWETLLTAMTMTTVVPGRPLRTNRTRLDRHHYDFGVQNSCNHLNTNPI